MSIGGETRNVSIGRTEYSTMQFITEDCVLSSQHSLFVLCIAQVVTCKYMYIHILINV